MAEPCIRLAETRDVAPMLSIYGPVVRDTTISFEEAVPGPEEFAARVHAVQTRYPWLVCLRDGVVVGYAYGSPFSPRAAYQWTVETTVYVSERATRQGVGRALYTSLLACLGLQSYAAAIGVIALPNPGSVGLHEAMGFEPFGVLPRAGFKHGAWHDVGYWRRPLSEADTPEPPSPPSDFGRDPRWARAVGSGEALLTP